MIRVVWLQGKTMNGDVINCNIVFEYIGEPCPPIRGIDDFLSVRDDCYGRLVRQNEPVVPHRDSLVICNIMELGDDL